FPISESTVETLTQAMYGVVNEGGTAAASRLPGIELCGKTGTAQVISAQGLQRSGKQAALRNNAWFVGFAPRRNPEIVVAVLVQAGGFGADSAAPIARDVVKAYYDKKQGVVQPQLTTQTKPAAPGKAVVAQIVPTGKILAQPEESTPIQPEPARDSKEMSHSNP